MCQGCRRTFLVVFLARRFVVGFVLELVKLASRGRLRGLLTFVSVYIGLSLSLVGIRSTIVFVFLFLGASAVDWARKRDALRFQGFLDLRQLLDKSGELLDVQRNTLAFGISIPCSSNK